LGDAPVPHALVFWSHNRLWSVGPVLRRDSYQLEAKHHEA
jgi:hypothetical protein